MKETKEHIKERILNDLANKRVKGIAWLQKEYGVGFPLAKEVYESLNKEESSVSKDI